MIAYATEAIAQPGISDPDCPADLTSDNEVDPADVIEFFAGNPNGHDYNDDGTADAIDFVEFQSDYIGTQGAAHCVDPDAIAQVQAYWEQGMVLAWPGLEHSPIALDGPLGLYDETVIGTSEDGEPVPFRLARVEYSDPSILDLDAADMQLVDTYDIVTGAAVGWIGVNEAPGLVWYYSFTLDGETHHYLQPVASLNADIVLADLRASRVIDTGVFLTGLPSLITTSEYPVSVMVPPWFKKFAPVKIAAFGVGCMTYSYNVLACGRLMDRTFEQELVECQALDTGPASACIPCALDAYLNAIEDCKAFPWDRALYAPMIEGCSDVASQ